MTTSIADPAKTTHRPHCAQDGGSRACLRSSRTGARRSAVATGPSCAQVLGCGEDCSATVGSGHCYSGPPDSTSWVCVLASSEPQSPAYTRPFSPFVSSLLTSEVCHESSDFSVSRINQVHVVPEDKRRDHGAVRRRISARRRTVLEVPAAGDACASRAAVGDEQRTAYRAGTRSVAVTESRDAMARRVAGSFAGLCRSVERSHRSEMNGVSALCFITPHDHEKDRDVPNEPGKRAPTDGTARWASVLPDARTRACCSTLVRRTSSSDWQGDVQPQGAGAILAPKASGPESLRGCCHYRGSARDWSSVCTLTKDC